MITYRITIVVDVDERATQDDVDAMVGNAIVQLAEPADVNGDNATFDTAVRSVAVFEI